MFTRILCILAAFDRREFCEFGLALRLGEYLERSSEVVAPSRSKTMAGMPVAWGEP
jgi:hypothetical protein